MKHLFRAFASVLLLLCLGGVHAQLSKGRTMTFQKLREGFICHTTQPLTQVIRTQKDWDDYWHTKIQFNPGEAGPKVDFTKDMVIVVHLGTRNTGGYSVHVDKIEKVSDKEIKVTYVEQTPNPREMVSMMVTSPYAAVTVPKFSGKVTFDHQKVVHKIG